MSHPQHIQIVESVAACATKAPIKELYRLILDTYGRISNGERVKFPEGFSGQLVGGTISKYRVVRVIHNLTGHYAMCSPVKGDPTAIPLIEFGKILSAESVSGGTRGSQAWLG